MNLSDIFSIRNSASERHVLAYLMLTGADGYNIVTTILDKDDFQNDFHSAFYEKLETLVVLGNPILPAKIKMEFRQAGVFDVDFDELFDDMLDQRVEREEAIVHAQEVRNLSVKRQLLLAADKLSEDAYSASSEAELNLATDDLRRSIEVSERSRGEAFSFEDVASVVRDSGISLSASDDRTDENRIYCGLKDVDHFFNGFIPGDLLAISSRTSVGKTALATTMAFEIARHAAQRVERNSVSSPEEEMRVHYFISEMTIDRLISRILAISTGLKSSDILEGKLTEAEHSKLLSSASTLQSLPLNIYNLSSFDDVSLLAKLKQLGRFPGRKVVFLDRLEDMLFAEHDFFGQRNYDDFTRDLKYVCSQFGILLVATAQSGRSDGDESEIPELSDIVGEGSIEQRADIVWMLHREEFFHTRVIPPEGTNEFLSWRKQAELIYQQADLFVFKNRRGRRGRIDLKFLEDIPCFTDK
tara:strand:+ start:1984 stop:3396 length:1413 start_codon:yes stop_codon:yes gene_type:complete